MNENAEQIDYWNGTVGERWAREQEAIDRAFTTFTARLLERAALRPGARVLDVGCGCGTLTLAAGEAVGVGGSVLGVDVSTPMLARARERSRDRHNLSYVLADAAEHTFDAPFDAAISRFGVMFFRHPAPAFAHLRRALRSGASLTFVCWQAVADNAWVQVPSQAVDPILPPAATSAPGDPGPFAFADPARVRAILGDAGFTSVEVVPFQSEVVLSDQGIDEAVRFAMTTGPTARRLREADDDTKARARARLAERLSPLLRGSRVALGGSVWIVSAMAP